MLNHNEKLERIREIDEMLSMLPPGSLVYKTINGKEQPYLQWTENGKQQTKYIKKEGREDAIDQAIKRKELTEERKKLTEEIKNLSSESSKTPDEDYKTNVIYGDGLSRLTLAVKGFHRRYCYSTLERYLTGNTFGRVCILYGLRRTGKTTLLLQAIESMNDEQRSRSVYIKARTSDTMSDLSSDLKILSSLGYEYIFIDEVTLLSDFIDSASILSDIFAMQGMKIVLSGTDSLGFWLTQTQELYDRAYMIHTTYIPFREYSYLLGIRDIDEYIRYGGTLKAGELAFDDDDALAADAAFRDDESTRRYIDTAICNNIQHSLESCRRGNYLRHLWSLYDAGELTSAINRIIERMNHRFVLRTLTDPFKSHDYGSAKELLEKQPDKEKRTDILSRIDREAITSKLMKLLDISNQENQSIGITESHVAEIKEYLTALDLVVDCPMEAMTAEPAEYVLFTQPGMRYCQAQALVHVLVNDEEFQAFSQHDRDLACAKILEDVRGRMLEDIVLLDTARALPRSRRAFKLTLSRSEFDMVIYSSDTGTCEAYEIKHSAEIVPRQYHVLEDAEQCALLEQQYGRITKKCVLYRGEPCVLDNGIEYLNVEEYLQRL